MAHNNTVLSQMLQLLPRHVFEHQVETHVWQDPKPRKLSYWSQLVAMLYAQLSGKKSLRDLVFSLGRHRQKLYHLGITPPVKRSSLGHANQQRPARIFSETYFKLLSRLEAELPRHPEPVGSKSWTPPMCRCVIASFRGRTLCLGKVRSSSIP